MDSRPSCLQVRGGLHPGWVSSSSWGSTDGEKHPFTLTFTPKVNVKSLVHLPPKCLSTVGGSWSTRKDAGKTWKLHTEKSSQDILTFLLWSSTTVTHNWKNILFWKTWIFNLILWYLWLKRSLPNFVSFYVNPALLISALALALDIFRTNFISFICLSLLQHHVKFETGVSLVPLSGQQPWVVYEV